MLILIDIVINQISPTQDRVTNQGLPAWAWILIVSLVIITVWWLLVRSAENQPVIQGHHTSMHVAETIPSEDESKQPKNISALPETDDLTRLEGIGPKVESALIASGITTYAQLASTSVNDLREILEKAGYKFMDPEMWPEQARLLSDGNIKEFEQLTSKLKGGRRT